MRVCIIGGHVLLFEMSYWGTCFTGVYILQDDLLYTGHLLYEDRFNWMVCPIESHVLMRACLTCEFVLQEYM